jgi:hypothetical protein
VGKLLVLALVAIVVAVGATRVDDVHSRLASLQTYVLDKSIRGGSPKPRNGQAEWVAFAATANRICADHGEADLSGRVPRNASQVVRALRRMVRAEKATLAGLSQLEPRASYKLGFAGFLNERKNVVLAVKRVIRTAKAGKRSAYERGLRDLARSSSNVSTYAVTAGMWSCQM